MTRTMYDSTNVADDPAGAQLVAFYIDGIYATTEAVVRARFPNAVLVPISAIGTNAGIVGDCENGDMSVAGVVIWVLMRRAAGFNPSVYCNQLNTWPALRAAFKSQNIPEPPYWVADYDGVAVIPVGAVAKQYENPPLDGGHFDKSIVADFWPGVDGLFSGGSGSLTPTRSQTSEDSTLALLAHPTIAGRLDLLVVGTDAKVYHFGGTAAQLTAGASPEVWGGTAAAGTLSATWTPDGQQLTVCVAGPDAKIYMRTVNLDGSVALDWHEIANAVALLPEGKPGIQGPQGLTGPQGATGPQGPAAPPHTHTVTGVTSQA